MALDVIAQFKPAQLGLDDSALAFLGGHLASFVFVFAMVLVLCALIPYKRRPWKELLPGALVAALLFELGKALFVLYLENVGSLEAVYGSLTSARVLLFGVEIIAVRREDRQASG